MQLGNYFSDKLLESSGWVSASSALSVEVRNEITTVRSVNVAQHLQLQLLLFFIINLQFRLMVALIPSNLSVYG